MMYERPVGVGCFSLPIPTVYSWVFSYLWKVVIVKSLRSTSARYSFWADSTLFSVVWIQPDAPFGRVGSRILAQLSFLSITGTQVGELSCCSGNFAIASPPTESYTGSVFFGCSTSPDVPACGFWSFGASGSLFFVVAAVRSDRSTSSGFADPDDAEDPDGSEAA